MEKLSGRSSTKLLSMVFVALLPQHLTLLGDTFYRDKINIALPVDHSKLPEFLLVSGHCELDLSSQEEGLLESC